VESRGKYSAAVSLLTVNLVCGLRPALSQTPQNLNAPSAQAVVAFLDQSIAWYRHLSVEQQLTTDASDMQFLRDDRQLADQIVRLSFDFAHAEAELMAKARTVQSAPEASDRATAGYQSLLSLAAKTEQQVKRSQAELDTLRQRLEVATGRRRQALQSAIEETKSELELA
jgi:hypothetical protein